MIARSRLAGLSILVPETREIDLFVAMLEAEGAALLRCPLVRILDVEDTGSVEAWVDRLAAGEFQDVVWLTGEGLRRIVGIAETSGRKQLFIDALARVRSITRGPKPVRALREIGLKPGLLAATPTSQGVLDALASETVAGRSVAVQLYPSETAAWLPEKLRDRGARVDVVTPYRYASRAETDQVVEAIRMLSAGAVGMVAFTSSPQVDRLLKVAAEYGLEAELHRALRKVPVAAIGPVVEKRLREAGIAAAITPETTYHLKPLVHAIVQAWASN
ncbi:MAG: uroporphyrinogen-III synthase [Alphaproteobacteria bacterium]|nr:uroporphyrinogen-III synthase [Alphaproteobacteria bacterium]